MLIIVVVLVLILAGLGGTYFWLNGKLNKTVALPAFTGSSAGTNWLIAGVRRAHRHHPGRAGHSCTWARRARTPPTR